MEVRILGSSGSVSGPTNPTSGYLVRPESSADEVPTPVLVDCGPGVLSQLQQVTDPAHTHVVFSHLHADHCLDFPSLLVWRRFHPTSPSMMKHHLIGPVDTPNHLGRLTADEPDTIEDMDDTFFFRAWRDKQPEDIAGLRITPYHAVHPIEAYSLRIEESATGAVVAYSGDSDWTENLVECARDADLFLCEATWCSSSEGKAPGMHMSGREAGRAARLAEAKHLVLIHIPPWGDPEAALEAARTEYEGPVTLGLAGDTWRL